MFLTSDIEVTRMALVPGLREGVAVVPFVLLAVLNELLPRVVAGVDEGAVAAVRALY